MAYMVKNILNLPVCKDFKLVAGQDGMSRNVRHVNLMDSEYDSTIPDGMEPDGLFDKEAIVVTSFLFSRKSKEKILPVIKQLFLDGVSALAIQLVCFEHLPDEVIEFSDSHKFPIFLFPKRDTFLENVVIGIATTIEKSDNMHYLEERLSFFLEPHLGQMNRDAVSDELFPDRRKPYRCFYFLLKQQTGEYAFYHRVEMMDEHSPENVRILPYRYGVLATVFGDPDITVENLEGSLGISTTEVALGVSRESRMRECLSHKIRESIFAARYGIKHRKNVTMFDDLGIQQIILPNKDNFWIRSYCTNVFQKLRDYDQNDDSELLKTVIHYVKNGLSVAKTAEYMGLHQNSVRYRISRACEILGLESRPAEFQEAIVLAVLFNLSDEIA
ncbi:PucR family transcriptional regulator [Lachnospiraceae bacterium YH-ros2226]